MIYFLIFLLIYTLFLLVIVVFGYLAQRLRENGYRGTEKDHIDLGELVVIVPFRNEQERIGVPLKSIRIIYVVSDFSQLFICPRFTADFVNC